MRQWTVTQVHERLKSQLRRYALTEHARASGWHQAEVVDEDLGRSGSGRVARPGFERLVAAVCDEAVGGVFALEASRLARTNRDWHHLVDLCGLTATLLIDGERDYDPRDFNDRMLLALKGTMSEWELGVMQPATDALALAWVVGLMEDAVAIDSTFGMASRRELLSRRFRLGKRRTSIRSRRLGRVMNFRALRVAGQYDSTHDAGFDRAQKLGLAAANGSPLI